MDSRNHVWAVPDDAAAEKLTQKDFDDILSRVGPNTYTLKLPDRFITKDNDARVFVIGCQGSGSNWQRKVADLMREKAKEKEPLIIIVLGDNIYNTGASSPLDKKLKTQFFDMNYPAPCVVLIGNHDGNYDKKSAWANHVASYTTNAVKQIVGYDVEKQEVIVTYLPTKNHSTPQQIEKFSKTTLSRDELNAWNMPYLYFSIIIGEKEFFFVNSNSIFADYLAYHNAVDAQDVPSNTKNQLAWLKHQYAQCVALGRMPILASHHPADITLGKRWASYDAWHYINDEQMTEINRRLNIDPPSQSFTKLFSKILSQHYLVFPFKLSAHDHFINYIKDENKNICQLTVGSGGGALHPFHKFNHPKSGCQIEQFGFASLTFPLKNQTPEDKIITIDIHTIEGLHLQFDTKNHAPIRWEGIKEFEQLRQKIIIASQAFFDTIKLPSPQKDTVSIGLFGRGWKAMKKSYDAATQAYEHMTKKSSQKKEPGIVQDILAYFNQYDAPSIPESYNFLHEKINLLKLTPESPNSFLSFLREELPEFFFDVTIQPSSQTLKTSRMVFDQ